MVHYLSFDEPRRGASEKPSRSENVDTDREQVPRCELGGALDAILKRVLGLRVMFGVGARIFIQTMDVKNAFRRVGVDPDGVSRFAHRLGQIIFVDSACSSGGGGTQDGRSWWWERSKMPRGG